jgi:uncharacterized protein (DUF1684 family)
LIPCLPIFALCAVALACSSPPPSSERPREAPSAEAYAAELEAHRTERETRLRAPDSWLSLVGLPWLEEGANPFGSAAENPVVFPENAPAKAGVFLLQNGQISVSAAEDSGLTLLAGEEETVLTPGELVPLLDDTAEGGPTSLTLGTLLFYPIRRGEKVGIRIKDSAAETLTNFAGLDYYPADLAWRLEGRFEPYDPPKPLPMPNVLGTVNEQPAPGALVFTVDGTEYRLDPTGDPGEPLFLVFGDQTNGKESYGGGRFLYVDPPDEEGRVVIDFNRAYNPPCVFTPYATCPLPPRSNKLPIAVEAGEKTYGAAH